MIQGDCIDVMDRLLANESILAMDGRGVSIEEKEAVFDFIIMDPPYNIHLEQTMSGNGGKSYAEKYTNRRSDYNMRSDHEGDLANLATYVCYLDVMSEVFERCYRLLRPGHYMAIIVRNAYQHAEYRDPTTTTVGQNEEKQSLSLNIPIRPAMLPTPA